MHQIAYVMSETMFNRKHNRIRNNANFQILQNSTQRNFF